nr:MAG TPA_asm: hypothetical protein [Caudoviricetes sp.]
MLGLARTRDRHRYKIVGWITEWSEERWAEQKAAASLFF